MKKKSTLPRLIGLLLLLSLTGTASWACNLSSFTLVSVTGSGPYVITANLCVGMGLTGATKGGDQSTRDISFGFYDADPGFTITAFTPTPDLCGPMGCCMPGAQVAPMGDQDGRILFTDPGYYGTAPCVTSPYGCVNSTLNCGPAQSYCVLVTFTVNQIPDSIRAYGVEGGGNPVGGCYPNPDMVIIFPPTSVVWGGFTAVAQTAGVQLDWSTTQESNVDFYQVERAGLTTDFETIGIVGTDGNSQTLRTYRYTDAQPLTGPNRYRIVQVDRAGQSQESQVVEVDYQHPGTLAWGTVSPNPTRDMVQLSFYSPRAAGYDLQVVDAMGRLVMRASIEAALGGNALELDLRSLVKGHYYLRLQGSEGTIVRKVTRL